MTITGQATNMGYRNRYPRSWADTGCPTRALCDCHCVGGSPVTYLSPTGESSLTWLWHGEGPFKPMEVIIT